MKKICSFLPLFLLIGVFLAACSGAQAAGTTAGAAAGAPVNAVPVETQAPQADQNASGAVDIPQYWVEKAPRLDEQGAVAVEIIPLNLNNAGGTLDFEVRMNTHSVDLSMNLAELATLSTDTGKTLQAVSWEGPDGGHHVRGKLSFPAGVDGFPLLEGVNKLTLTLVNVDAPARVFVWEK